MNEDLPLSISLKYLPYQSLVLIGIIGDGSCFFHAILRAFLPNYYYSNINDRKSFAKYIRYSLAEDLTEITSSGKMIYDSLSNGELRRNSIECPQLKCSLSDMINELKSEQFVGNHYHELISEKLNKDIYIINLKTQDVYATGVILNIFYKNRDSIFIGYDEDRQHFDLIGIRNTDLTISTLFQPDHQFTLLVKNRLKILSK